MPSTTTVTGPLNTPNLDPSSLEGKFVIFTLLTAGTEAASNETIDAEPVGAQIDANGDFSVDLWVNGESGIESVYSIKLPYRKGSYQVIIPSSAAGGSISLEELMDFHQVSGSSPQQSDTLAEAREYTDSLAKNPNTFVPLVSSNWKLALDYSIPGDNISIFTNDAGFIGDAPSVGTSYVREDAAWKSLLEGIATTESSVIVTSPSYIVANNDLVILADDDTAGGDVTIDLGSILTGFQGIRRSIKKLGSTGTVIIDPNGSGNIDGGATATLTAQYESITITNEAGNWYIL